jgi:hypothetical protein
MKLGELVLGSRHSIAGTVYGTIVVLAVLAEGSDAYAHELWRLDVLLVVTSFVLWIAHVYAHGLGESMSLGHRLDIPEFRTIVVREFSILAAALAPAVVIALGALHVLEARVAVWLAIGIAVTALAVEGARYARLERLTTFGTLFTIALNLALGLAIVLLKVVVAH